MRRFIIFCLILSTTVLGSCKKFLAEYSQDEMRPGSTEDLTALMNGDAYPYNAPIDNFDLLTDDVQSNGLAVVNNAQVSSYVTPYMNGTAIFKFDPTMFDSNNTIPPGANLYQTCYSKIKGCNVIMDYLPNVAGTEQAKNAIVGQCLFLRAYYYLKLVTTYCQPYSGLGVNPETSLGLPLVLSSEVRDGGLSRPTLKQTYDQIEKDLLQATSLLKANYVPSSPYRVGATVANALLSRFYLYRGLDSDGDKVISSANAVLAERNTLTALSTFFTPTGAFSRTGIFDPGNTEVLWIYGSNLQNDRTYFPALLTGATPPYTVSTSLSTLYEQGPGTTNYGDLRYQMYFNTYTNGGTFLYFTAKSTQNSVSGTRGFRLSEVYLNRTEALINRFIKSGNTADRTQALADLNYLRSNRYDTRNTAYSPIAITDGAALYTFYQQERRRELALEDGHRWQDIKRWRQSVTHVYKSADGASTTYTLPENSLLYALPIPFTALATNVDLVQNPR
ncbi:RagB/SusD family nutrient uptake outer membrane protein [Pedobacter sp. MC2016-14]|uniref:RagB/SusD family nutrient uptake outer membrane protein n=1 Tax=Pedobacter sp. MC2016-14 TaxID=2897327 RepID=UPI001E321875|nr:RagB/SusD family nutrient uptake outer membrane protein [Pedobacter sp. MC2016-14]MCD0489192.1 RagB/SusD family nutrient uptake outer membrane protein [Pedobacter sp. MC2016-14]